MLFRYLVLLIILILPTGTSAQASSQKPMRIAVIGLVHTHVHWVLGREDRGDIEIVGIAEPNTELAREYSKRHGYSMDLVYSSMEEMIEKTKPEAVLAFNTIYDHLKVVEYCAPKGIHVMVEKPLAVSLDHASKMAFLARKYNIHLLTNFETSWYGSTALAKKLIGDSLIGDIRKIIFYTGHPGPIEIGCNKEFLEWLTDPVLNGGGALTDFGCYGANIATWLMNGEEPLTVNAITQQIKPHLYPKVEDEATILAAYTDAQIIIQASWNWPYNRKEMEIYGTDGYIFCRDGSLMEVKLKGEKSTKQINAPPLDLDRNDPFIYFVNIIRGTIKMQPFDLASLENNLQVMVMLEKAKTDSLFSRPPSR